MNMASNFEKEAMASSDEVNKDNLNKLTSLKSEIDSVLHATDSSPEQIAEKISNEFFNAPQSEIEDTSASLEDNVVQNSITEKPKET